MRLIKNQAVYWYKKWIFLGIFFSSALLVACSNPSSASNDTLQTTESTILQTENDISQTLESNTSITSESNGFQSSEGPGFDSTEEVALAYLNGLKNEDLDSMLKTFAIESFVENYDFDKSLSRVGGYTYSSRMNLPNSSEFIKNLNIERQKNLATETITNQYLALCEFNQAQVVSFNDEITVNEFTYQLNETLNAPNMQELKILGFISPAELYESFSSEAYMNNLSDMAACYGADQVEDCIIAFELDNYCYLLYFQSITYNDRWYISNMGGMHGTAATGGIETLPPEYFNEVSPYIVPVE